MSNNNQTNTTTRTNIAITLERVFNMSNSTIPRKIVHPACGPNPVELTQENYKEVIAQIEEWEKNKNE